MQKMVKYMAIKVFLVICGMEVEYGWGLRS